MTGLTLTHAHAALPLRPEKLAKRSKVSDNELVTQWKLSRTGEGRESVTMSYLEHQTSALVLCMHKTSVEGRRSDESGVMTQYNRNGSAKRTMAA